MSRTSTLILLGILIVLTPFSGFPISFRTLLAVVFGACVSGIGLSMRAHEVRGPLPSVEAPPTVPPQDVSPI